MFCNCEVLEEIYVSKNQLYTKHPIERVSGLPLFGTNIINMDSNDPSFKKKRKALQTAFSRSKAEVLTHRVKQATLAAFADL